MEKESSFWKHFPTMMIILYLLHTGIKYYDNQQNEMEQGIFNNANKLLDDYNQKLTYGSEDGIISSEERLEAYLKENREVLDSSGTPTNWGSDTLALIAKNRAVRAQNKNLYAGTGAIQEQPSGNLLIDNISRDLNGFYNRGWNKLYELNEFDCSRMSTYMWDYIRNKYKVAPVIVIAPNREHAWVALKVVDVGDTDRYLQWNIKGVQYYFIEATAPGVVKYEKDYYMGIPPQWYESTADYYTTRMILADDPAEANINTRRWANDFRLTKQDIDKLNSFSAEK